MGPPDRTPTGAPTHRALAGRHGDYYSSSAAPQCQAAPAKTPVRSDREGRFDDRFEKDMCSDALGVVVAVGRPGRAGGVRRQRGEIAGGPAPPRPRRAGTGRRKPIFFGKGRKRRLVKPAARGIISIRLFMLGAPGLPMLPAPGQGLSGPDAAAWEGHRAGGPTRSSGKDRGAFFMSPPGADESAWGGGCSAFPARRDPSQKRHTPRNPRLQPTIYPQEP